ncbi:Nif3-like dinuclear metal center hexameric protein [Inmirania thermothiophila]|uniref:GTP cyclohydrolase 1 type 2 homolog n=1 Tax=Inmirania thermothiophila TaxID=1750597 RepID=A0A3N1XWU3_9GAMM|nr:Nif3-like dinuclear metal center hexameric protein [Inmirania thermothiophila]ROR29662.1 dinuclear metal center YbgI/SA1388 family protein [Inmirania thermothiophila]
MVDLRALVAYLDTLLECGRIQDYAPNGLQVEGRARVGRLVTGVSASLALLEAAREAGADAVLVHHGYFWRGESPCVTGMRRARLALLLEAQMSLLAYHLPLDAHPKLGNNAALGRILGLPQDGRFAPGEGPEIVFWGELPEPLPLAELARRVATRLGRDPLVVAGGEHPVRRIAWCSGAAQGYLEAVAARGFDAYLSGEISEPTFHAARELGVHYLAAGHHATERYGVRTLGEHLAQHFGIEHRHVEIDNPV